MGQEGRRRGRRTRPHGIAAAGWGRGGEAAAGERYRLTRDGCGEARMAVTRARERAGRLLRAVRLRQQQARAAAELWYVTG